MKDLKEQDYKNILLIKLLSIKALYSFNPMSPTSMSETYKK